ncbi:MAG: Holliday junction resolvase RuvX [Anaerolineaceae bacterium]
MLGVDPGSLRIGIAISDGTGTLARPLSILKHISRQQDAQKIAMIASENNCDTIVVGTPLDSEGNIGPRARASLKLIDAIRALTALSVVPWDESGSSMKVYEIKSAMNLSRKQRPQPIDDQAAAIILSDYLDHHPLEERIEHESKS